MKNKIFLIIGLFLMTSLYSCTKLYHMNQPKDPVTEYSSVYPLSGEWYVTYKFDDGSGIIDDYYGVGTVPLDTYNDAAEDVDSLWITDYDGSAPTFWQYTVKVGCSVDGLTFSKDTAVSAEVGYHIWTNVTNGKVIKDAVTQPSGTVSDSIYFEIEFADDPGTIYYCSGHRKSGFLEDQP